MRIRFGGAAIASHLLPAHVISVPTSPAFLDATVVRAIFRGTTPLWLYTLQPPRKSTLDRRWIRDVKASWDFSWNGDDGIALCEVKLGAYKFPVSWTRVFKSRIIGDEKRKGDFNWNWKYFKVNIIRTWNVEGSTINKLWFRYRRKPFNAVIRNSYWMRSWFISQGMRIAIRFARNEL